MTLRLSALFESHIKTVISNWKAARRRANKNKSRSGTSGRGSSSSPTKRAPSDRTRSTGKRGTSSRNTRRIHSSEESSNHDDDDDNEPPRGTQRSARGSNNRGGTTASTSSSNRVTSSSSHKRHNDVDDPQPGTSRASRQRNRAAGNDEEEDALSAMSSESDEDDSESGTSSTSTSSDNSLSENSEESYSPEKDRKTKSRKRHHKSGRKTQKGPRNKRTRRRLSDEDTDEDFDLESHKKHKNTGRKVRRSQNQRSVGGGAVSHVDESTQDTITHTPKKKGRPPKSSSRTQNDASNSLLESPSRNTRTQAVSQTNSSGVGRRSAAENDHSYHLPVRNGRVVESDNDSREVATRPTRASVKRAIMEWARAESDGDGTEDAEEVSTFQILHILLFYCNDTTNVLLLVPTPEKRINYISDIRRSSSASIQSVHSLGLLSVGNRLGRIDMSLVPTLENL